MPIPPPSNRNNAASCSSTGDPPGLEVIAVTPLTRSSTKCSAKAKACESWAWPYPPPEIAGSVQVACSGSASGCASGYEPELESNSRVDEDI